LFRKASQASVQNDGGFFDRKRAATMTDDGRAARFNV